MAATFSTSCNYGKYMSLTSCDWMTGIDGRLKITDRLRIQEANSKVRANLFLTAFVPSTSSLPKITRLSTKAHCRERDKMVPRFDKRSKTLDPVAEEMAWHGE